jgi:hypothetical protein
MVSQPYSFPAVFMNFVVWGSQDSSGGIQMGYRLDSWGLIPGRSKRFFYSPHHPDQLWSPPSLLSNEHWGLFAQG